MYRTLGFEEEARNEIPFAVQAQTPVRIDYNLISLPCVSHLSLTQNRDPPSTLQVGSNSPHLRTAARI